MHDISQFAIRGSWWAVHDVFGDGAYMGYKNNQYPNKQSAYYYKA